MSEYRKVAYKPGDEDDTRIVLRSDGRLFVYGDVADPEVNLEWNKGSYRDVARDLQVTDWETPSGYILSGWGTVHAFGAAVAPPSGSDFGAPTSVKGWDIFRGIMMNPAADGRGYRLRADGLVERFGSTLPADIGTGPGSNSIKNGAAIDIVGDLENWGSDMKFFVLDQYGKIWPCNGANSVRMYSGETVGWKAVKYMRSIQVATWDPRTTGYVMDHYGRVFSFSNPAEDEVTPPAKTPNWRKQGWAVGRDFHLIDDSPLQYKLFLNSGATHTVFVSDPAVVFVTVPEPADEVTDTRNPTIEWSYEDPEGDRPSKYEIRVFRIEDTPGLSVVADELVVDLGFNVETAEAFYSYDETDYRVVGHQVADDLENGEWAVAVRSVEETSGYLSDWSMSWWTQNVELAAAPTVVVEDGGMSDEITVTDVADAYLAPVLTLQVLTRDGWQDALRGLYVAVEDGDASVVYWEPPQRVAAQYRARIYESDDDTLYTDWIYFSGATRNTHATWISRPLVNGSELQVSVAEFTRSNPVISSTFQPVGDHHAVVVTEENPVKGSTGSLKLNVLDPVAQEDVWNLIFSGEPLLYRDQFGEAIYFSLVDSVDRERLKAGPLPFEETTVRDASIWTIGIVEIKRPS